MKTIWLKKDLQLWQAYLGFEIDAIFRLQEVNNTLLDLEGTYDEELK